MPWSLLLAISLLFTLTNSTRGEWGQIKINEPRASSSNNYGSNNDNNNNNNNDNNNAAASSTSYRDPHSETENSEIVIQSVIEYLTNRKGEIVEGTHDKYTYKIFLFEKVEQSENWYSWNLGIFDKWDYCDSNQQSDSELCLQFTDGQICGNGVGRSSHIHIICDMPDDKDNTKEHLYDITEPETCSYHMNMYIPQICELINNNINNLFLDRDNTNSQTPQTQNTDGISDVVSNNVNIISDTSGLMNKLNDMMKKQNEQSELDQLWKLCLMSLIIDDEGKLNKIQKVASMFMGGLKDVDSEQTGICDFYLEQMLDNKKQTDAPLPHEDDTIETTGVEPVVEKSTGVLISNEENTDFVIEETENENENGLLQLLEENNDDVDDDVNNNDDNDNDEVVFQSGDNEVVFQSGSNQDDENENEIEQQDDIIEDLDDEEEVFDVDFDTDTDL
eukprot:254621_1